MDDQRSILETHSRAANRRASEVLRLSQQQREELAGKIEAISNRHSEDLRKLREQQASRRDTDMASARQDVLTQKWERDLTPPDVPSARRVHIERVERLATRKVNAANAREVSICMTTMEQETSAAVESFFAAQPEFAAERESIDLARARWSELRAVTRCVVPGRDDGGHER